MEVTIPFGNETHTLTIDLPPEQVIVAKSKNPIPSRNWAEVVAEAIDSPINAQPIHRQKLQGKKVVIITDDWGRPTPASEVVPLILSQLESIGVEDSDITFITASGMHAPMSQEELARKLGQNVVARYRCVSHDGGDWSNLAFCGVSSQGTPIWINRYVAEADYKIALGRIYLHEAYGYEGGYKMILPGVSGFDTITRDHGFNFSPECVPGNHDNPARREADAVGQIVGIDFLINVVVNRASEPLKAFCGEPMAVHRQGIAWGDREVWGAAVGAKADVAIVSPGTGQSGFDIELMYRAACVTKEGGTIIALSQPDAVFDSPEGTSIADEALYALDQAAFQAVLPQLAFPELFRLHEKRDWPLSEREIQYRIKSLRGEFYHRRRIQDIWKRKLVLTTDPNAALQHELKSRKDARVIVIPEGRTTLAKMKLV